MLIPSKAIGSIHDDASLSRRVNANSQRTFWMVWVSHKLIKKGEC